MTVQFEADSQLTSIGNYAFRSVGNGSQMAGVTITIPKSVQTIGNYAFNNCSYISIAFEANSQLETIGA